MLEKQAKRWTYADYAKLDDDQRYEIIDGNLLMAPSPDTWHQDWAGELFLILRQHVTRAKLGRVYFAPLDVVLDVENTVQPDLIFVASANAGIIRQRGIFGASDLVVELISPESGRRDRQLKRELYARFGVKEYWIGDPINQTLEVLALKAGGYELHCRAEGKGKLTSLVLPGLEFDLAELQIDPGWSGGAAGG